MEYCTGDMHWGGSMYRSLVGKPEGKRSLGRPKRRWDDNIKIDRKKVGWEYVDSSASG
jgi:hypothetical protein